MYLYSNRQSVKKLFKKSPGRSSLPDGNPAANFTLSPGKPSQALQNMQV